MLSWDSGWKAIGWAQWGGKSLLACGVAESKRPLEESLLTDLMRQVPHGEDESVVEAMEWHPHRSKSQPNDLLKVQRMTSALAGLVSDMVDHV